MSAAIFFRFKSERERCIIPIEGAEISVRELKDKIAEIKKLKDDGTQKKKGPNQNYSLSLLHSTNEEEYKEENELIPAGTYIIGKRVSSAIPTPIPIIPAEAGPAQNNQTIKPREEETVSSKLAKIIITGKLPSILACQLCNKILKNPYITTCCGYTACQTCFTTKCPACSKDLEIISDKQLEKFLLSIEDKLREVRDKSAGITEFLESAKYFLLQVYNPQTLETSLKTSTYPIPPDNSFKLNSSFQPGKNVIVIFVNSAAGQFHGCGVMMSPIIHKKNDIWGSSEFISVKWLRRADVSFVDTQHLDHPIPHNSLTQPVEELDSNSGLELCLKIEQAEQKEVPDYQVFEVENQTAKEEGKMEIEEIVKEEETKRKRSRSPEEKRKSSPHRSRKRSKERKSPESKYRNRESPKRHKHKEKKHRR
ncbi:unnamed protein product [Blepharisma stoltei]|uniref:Uncharacterized protein n=1 Tax=Blepharisma stoltei TaxID=1481888 RepID=A0AAU9JDB8_9CILI|nr:unnamed protein product [Blepharisma stoltei]